MGIESKSGGSAAEEAKQHEENNEKEAFIARQLKGYKLHPVMHSGMSDEQLRRKAEREYAQIGQREKAAQEHEKTVSIFFSKQLELAGNGRVVAMTQDGAALVIKFENGHEIFIDSDGNGDPYHASVIMRGSDTPPSDDAEVIEGEELLFHDKSGQWGT